MAFNPNPKCRCGQVAGVRPRFVQILQPLAAASGRHLLFPDASPPTCVPFVCTSFRVGARLRKLEIKWGPRACIKPHACTARAEVRTNLSPENRTHPAAGRATRSARCASSATLWNTCASCCWTTSWRRRGSSRPSRRWGIQGNLGGSGGIWGLRGWISRGGEVCLGSCQGWTTGWQRRRGTTLIKNTLPLRAQEEKEEAASASQALNVLHHPTPTPPPPLSMHTHSQLHTLCRLLSQEVKKEVGTASQAPECSLSPHPPQCSYAHSQLHTLCHCVVQEVKKEVDTAVEESKAAAVPPLDLVWKHVYATVRPGGRAGGRACICLVSVCVCACVLGGVAGESVCVCCVGGLGRGACIRAQQFVVLFAGARACVLALTAPASGPGSSREGAHAHTAHLPALPSGDGRPAAGRGIWHPDAGGAPVMRPFGSSGSSSHRPAACWRGRAGGSERHASMPHGAMPLAPVPELSRHFATLRRVRAPDRTAQRPGRAVPAAPSPL